MTAQQAILTLGTVTLTGCGGGLVLVHDNNPLLKGLNWMGTALVIGGLAAGFTLATASVKSLEPVANFCILVAFLCCYRAEHYLVGVGARQSGLERWLLGCESAAALLQWMHVIDTRGAIVILGLVVAVQLETTARLIQKGVIAKGRSAALFTAGLMRLLVAANILRAACAAWGVLSDPRARDTVNLLTYGLFVSCAIALAFAFFWRTTTKLSVELEHMASTDPLTRVFNRRVFLNWCESEQSRSQRLQMPFSVLMVDFDHFKKINDTFGHLVGDQVLCAGVERIQDSIRGIDVLCRWGGEEFAVLLPNASAEATQIVAERVRRNVLLVKALDPRFAGELLPGLHLSASIGTATYGGGDDNFQSMLQRADSALYEAKRNGRNRVVAAREPSALSMEDCAGRLVLEAQ